jgi:hypothetical protein
MPYAEVPDYIIEVTFNNNLEVAVQHKHVRYLKIPIEPSLVAKALSVQEAASCLKLAKREILFNKYAYG